MVSPCPRSGLPPTKLGQTAAGRGAFFGTLRRMRSGVRGLLVLVGAGAMVAGCLVEPVDLGGRACPCADGWACSAITDQCCMPDEYVENLRVAAATERQIWWAWEPTAPMDAPFSGYWLVVTTEPSVLDTYDPTAGDPPPPSTFVYDHATNQELAGLVVTGTGGADFVRGTITGGLTPNTTYHARLFTLDGDSCPWRSEVITTQTSSTPPNEIVIYDDGTGLDLFPDSFVAAPDPSPDHAGDEALVWDTASTECLCEDGSACSRCSENLKLNDGSGTISVTDVAHSGSSFEGPERRAILELTLTHDSPSPFHFARTWLMFSRPDEAGCGGPCGARFGIEPFSMQASGTQTFQILLSELEYASGGGPGCEADRHLELADLEGAAVCQFNFGSQWPQGTVVVIDDVRIRY